jgi:adenosylmethionine-8-amino-7-oxononanoate aminotransferase
VIQISPPLVAGQEEFDKIASILGDVLTEAWAELEKGRGKALAQA